MSDQSGQLTRIAAIGVPRNGEHNSPTLRRIASGEQEYEALYDTAGRLVAERWVTRCCVAEFAPSANDRAQQALATPRQTSGSTPNSGFLSGLARLVGLVVFAAFTLGVLGLGALVGFVIGDVRGLVGGSLAALFLLGWLLSPGDRER